MLATCTSKLIDKIDSTSNPSTNNNGNSIDNTNLYNNHTNGLMTQSNNDYMIMNNIDQHNQQQQQHYINAKNVFYPWKKHENLLTVEQSHTKLPILGPSSSASSSSSSSSSTSAIPVPNYHHLNMSASSNPHDFLYAAVGIETNYQNNQNTYPNHHQFIQKAFQDTSNSLYTNWWDVNNCWFNSNLGNNTNTTNNTSLSNSTYSTNLSQQNEIVDSINNNENYSYGNSNHNQHQHHLIPSSSTNHQAHYQNSTQNTYFQTQDSVYKPYLSATSQQTKLESLNNSNNSNISSTNNNESLLKSSNKRKSNEITLKRNKTKNLAKINKLNENSIPNNSEINSNIEDSTAATTTVTANSSSIVAVTPSTTTTVSKPRYSGRSQCDCPNCQEADSLGPVMSAQLKKRNIHSCHIAGCGKIYNKTSHLKAHLRWHTG
jgi:hypothetical protein